TRLQESPARGANREEPLSLFPASLTAPRAPLHADTEEGVCVAGRGGERSAPGAGPACRSLRPPSHCHLLAAPQPSSSEASASQWTGKAAGSWSPRRSSRPQGGWANPRARTPGPGSARSSARGWGHGYTERHLIKRNLGEAGNHQVIEATQGRKDRNVAMRTDSSKMTDVEPVVNNFASSARTGRRNAVPDIQGSAGTGGISELPLRLEALSMEEDVKKKDEETTQCQLEKPPKEEK
uniref:cAMP-dependent protein kinase inhibitor beta n=3 Tax=Felinae TaxID=338152 RepID=A0ABI7XFE6_FELCA